MKAFPRPLVKCSEAVNNSLWIRRVMGVFVILLLGTANIVDMVSCTSPSSIINCTTVEDAGKVCLYPSYFTYFCVLVLVAASLPAQLSYLFKAGLLFLISAAHCVMNVTVIGSALDCEEAVNHRDWANIAPGKYTLCGLLMAVTLALASLARHMEKASRVLFLWKNEVEEQRECASDIRRRNEALVYNILPPHVAAHFMGSRKRQHEELYSQSYAETGVLFASMPNFSGKVLFLWKNEVEEQRECASDIRRRNEALVYNILPPHVAAHFMGSRKRQHEELYSQSYAETDFYSEETVNNQGLECLRFLNEVISDFDALLEQPKFQDIIKIKTIGSTYMAASGLNPSRQIKPEDTLPVRWAHLSLLVEFALELKKALQGINEQSFNHFVLKMGINHGPIIAGVIGARKPHYDIWGNTVNVASRMESTGKAGCIQVTDETTGILQHFGYVFEQRGLVSVKGKGQLMTYYLIGKGDEAESHPKLPATPNHVEDATSHSDVPIRVEHLDLTADTKHVAASADTSPLIRDPAGVTEGSSETKLLEATTGNDDG
uniref:adenylate cyclase n=1 Tax=Timema shepardi TaxID=629360 RepID=A0A7R9AY31_TIMSH|nr:unnamed protein product [Timema shepardi]